MKFKILLFITALFIGVGFITPYVNSEFDSDYDSPDVDYVGEDLENYDPSGIGILSGPSVAGSILSMFFWTFGALPTWLDMIFLVFRVVFFFLLVDLFWIG